MKCIREEEWNPCRNEKQDKLLDRLVSSLWSVESSQCWNVVLIKKKEKKRKKRGSWNYENAKNNNRAHFLIMKYNVFVYINWTQNKNNNNDNCNSNNSNLIIIIIMIIWIIIIIIIIIIVIMMMIIIVTIYATDISIIKEIKGDVKNQP